MPLYWVSLCLNNLLDNAFLHGGAPVQLIVSLHNGRLTLQITDSGSLSADRLSELRHILSPQAGVGLGLTIVQRVAKRLNGKLTFSTLPTTFTLELPCDT